MSGWMDGWCFYYLVLLLKCFKRGAVSFGYYSRLYTFLYCTCVERGDLTGWGKHTRTEIWSMQFSNAANLRI
jgi:hypothetical protein